MKAIHEVQQKSNFKNLLLEKKLGALADTLEKKEAQLNEVLSASNLDPTALTVVTRKLEVSVVNIQPWSNSPHRHHLSPKPASWTVSLQYILYCDTEPFKIKLASCF